MHPDNFDKYKTLREQYPVFIYESYDISQDADQTVLKWKFQMGDDLIFNPGITIPHRGNFVTENLSVEKLHNLVFNIGLIELISYWKAACPTKIIIRPHAMDDWQVNWWKKLYFRGLGEFFYRNGIQANQDSFVEIVTEGPVIPAEKNFISNSSVLVPVGGGKDSAVTLEILKRKFQVIPFAMNPRNAIWDTITNSGIGKEDAFIMHRSLDPLLLELNEKGFLNGHTPFSALIAFTSMLAATMTGSRHVALSNESSANESTVMGSHINHQYSKSIEFESDFREYSRRYLTRDFVYFSFLRPLSELQIIKLFTTFPQHYLSFRSCNVGSKTDTWCCSCPKCLFAYIMLSAFMGKEELMKIFGEDLYKNEALIPVLDELTGRAPEKPFECVGTVDEVNLALVASLSGAGTNPPALLAYYRASGQYSKYRDIPLEDHLNRLDDKHYLSDEYMALLKSSL